MAFYGPYEGYIQKISECIEHNYPKNIHLILSKLKWSASKLKFSTKVLLMKTFWRHVFLYYVSLESLFSCTPSQWKRCTFTMNSTFTSLSIWCPLWKSVLLYTTFQQKMSTFKMNSTFTNFTTWGLIWKPVLLYTTFQ